MSMRSLAATAGVGTALVGAYKFGESSYRQTLKQRMPEEGAEYPIIPFMKIASEVCDQSGLDIEFMGGPIKQSLCDSETEFIPDNKQILVSSNPDCRTRKKATLYRPNYTIRDLDILVTRIDNQPAITPKYNNRLKDSATILQKELDSEATYRGLTRGPEVSLFAYEPRYKDFRISHYATRTHFLLRGNEMTHSLGSSQKFKEQDKWQFSIETDEGTVHLPTASPVRILGRTLTRSLIIRQRDEKEVYQAINNLEGKGLGDTLLGDEWEKYQLLRKQLDSSFELKNIRKQTKPLIIANFILAKTLAPLAPRVEDSYLADMIQDPDSAIFRILSRVMGVNERES